jgi:ClpP class serine protease
MQTKIYSILPEAAMEWEQRKQNAVIPQASLDDDKKALAEYFSLIYNQRKPMVVTNGLAIIHVHDFLCGGLTFLDRCLGGTDYADIAADIRTATNDPAITCVLLDIESGGGSAVGCVEVGKMVVELSQSKPVTAYTDSMMCSAAYCIAAGASEIFASESAFVGSIGTIMTWFDYAALLTKEGITPHTITSKGADLKASGNSFASPTPAELEHLQSIADDYGDQFASFVLREKPQIQTEGFRGQAVSGREAVRMGYIGGTISREELVSFLQHQSAQCTIAGRPVSFSR